MIANGTKTSRSAGRGRRRPCRRASTVLRAAKALCLLLTAGAALAAVGDLDPSFNQTGRLTTSFVGAGVRALDAAVQQDGTIVLAVQHQAVELSFALMRLAPDGAPLPTISGGGLIFPGGVGGPPAQARPVAVHEDDKIVLAGSGSFGGTSRLVVARLNADGTADSSFAGDGGVGVSFGPGSTSSANAVAIQRDGRIIAAGQVSVAGTSDFALARFNPDGSPDLTFGGDGTVNTDFGGDAVCLAVSVQKDGKIVAAGTENEDNFAIARYAQDGTLDSSFGAGTGRVITDFGGEDSCEGLAIQKDGKIVAVGSSNANVGFEVAIARYQKNGRLDRTFDRDGRLLSGLGNASGARDVALQTNGRIVVAGFVIGAGVGTDFLVARYQQNGRLDRSFGDGGVVTTDFGGSDSATGVAIQRDGRILAAGGHSTTASGAEVAVARYLAR